MRHEHSGHRVSTVLGHSPRIGRMGKPLRVCFGWRGCTLGGV